MRLDVTAETDWQRVIADIERQHGRLDGLVNAAGIVVLGSVEQLDFATWRRVLGVNLDGAFLGCKYSFPLLRKKGGAIVNLSSVSALVGGHNLAAYNASKGGLSLLTKSVALTGARCKPPVRCNAVCPAFSKGRWWTASRRRAYPDAVEPEAVARHSARPSGQAGGGRRFLRLSFVGRGGLHYRRGFTDRRRVDRALGARPAKVGTGFASGHATNKKLTRASAR